MLYGKKTKYRTRGLICYRLDGHMNRASGRRRAVWVQRGVRPWKLCSVHDGGARQLVWEMDATLSGRAMNYARGLFEQYAKVMDQRDAAREERSALLKEGDDLRIKLLNEDLRLCVEARTVLHDELLKSKQFRRLEEKQLKERIAELEAKLREKESP